MPITLQTSAGPEGLVDCWDDYAPGFDASRGPFINKSYLNTNWVAWKAIANALMGVSGSGNAYPHRCPEAPNLLAQAVEVVGVGENLAASAGGPPVFNLARFRVTYAIPPWPTFPDDQAPQFPNDDGGSGPWLFMEQDIDFSAEIIKIPETTYKFQGSGNPVDVPIFKSMPVAEFVIVRKWQTTMPFGNISSYLNRLNSNQLFGQPKGTLMLTRVRTKRSFMTDGTRSQDVSYTFKLRLVDHNKFMQPTDATFDFIVDTNGNYVYDYADIGQVLL